MWSHEFSQLDVAPVLHAAKHNRPRKANKNYSRDHHKTKERGTVQKHHKNHGGHRKICNDFCYFFGVEKFSLENPFVNVGRNLLNFTFHKISMLAHPPGVCELINLKRQQRMRHTKLLTFHTKVEEDLQWRKSGKVKWLSINVSHRHWLTEPQTKRPMFHFTLRFGGNLRDLFNLKSC